MRVDSRSLSSLRWRARAPRVLALAGLLVCAVLVLRSAARPEATTEPPARVQTPFDLRAEGFAEAFARAYLTWDAADPASHERAVARYTSQALNPGAGMHLPRVGKQRVLWTRTVVDEPRSHERLITVAAETSRQAVDLIVAVARDPRGMLFISRYPAIVAQSPADPGASPAVEQPVDDSTLLAVVRRAVRNFVSGQRADLLADLDRGAFVVVPQQRLRPHAVRDVTWVLPQRRVAAVVEATAPDGTGLTLQYELDVVRRAGRWLVRSVGTNPISEEDHR